MAELNKLVSVVKEEDKRRKCTKCGKVVQTDKIIIVRKKDVCMSCFLKMI